MEPTIEKIVDLARLYVAHELANTKNNYLNDELGQRIVYYRKHAVDPLHPEHISVYVRFMGDGTNLSSVEFGDVEVKFFGAKYETIAFPIKSTADSLYSVYESATTTYLSKVC